MRNDNPWPKSNPSLPFTTEQLRMGSTPNDFVEEQTLFDTSCLEPERPCVGIPNSICTLTRHCMCVPGFKKTPFGCRSSGLEESSFPPFIEIRNRTHHAKERRPIAIKTQCKQGYVEVKGHCIVGIFLGERCQQDEQCQYYTPDSHCNREICSCSHGFVPSGNATCLPARGLASECIINEQCQVPKSGCEKGICDCIANYVAKNGLCFAGLNQACSEIFGGAELRCADDQNHVCAAGVCQCRGRVLRGLCIPAL